MATTQITVPGVVGDLAFGVRDSVIKEVSTILDAGNDVQFVFADGTQAAAYGLFLNVGGAVKLRGPLATGDAVTLTFVEGGWHLQAVGFIYAVGTDAALGLHVKMS